VDSPLEVASQEVSISSKTCLFVSFYIFYLTGIGPGRGGPPKEVDNSRYYDLLKVDKKAT